MNIGLPRGHGKGLDPKPAAFMAGVVEISGANHVALEELGLAGVIGGECHTTHIINQKLLSASSFLC
jgi:hypothetical protein